MIEDKDEEKYEKPDVTQIVHALIIYGLVVFLGFCLLIGLANHPEPVTKNTVTREWKSKHKYLNSDNVICDQVVKEAK